ncbi:MAG: hypothetical protein PF508_19500 [Spirochaeta sp.]|jgi:hypothetical protein|nr:hypothetical protein [Spirochaeta sp.]
MAAKPAQPQTCELCGRETTLTFHHLIPKKTHRKRRVLRRFAPDELHTRAAILADPLMARFLGWARKQK